MGSFNEKTDNKTIIRQFLSAVQDNDSAVLAKVWHEQGVWQYGFPPPSFPKQIVSREAVIKTVESAASHFDGLTFYDIDIFQTEDTDIAFAEFNSKAIIKKSGKDYHNSYCCKFIIKEQQIVLFRDCFDSYQTAVQLGLIPLI